MITHIVLLPDIVQKCFCTLDGPMDPAFFMKYVPDFQHVCNQRNLAKTKLVRLSKTLYNMNVGLTVAILL